VLNLAELRPPSSASRQAATRSATHNRVADRVAREIALTILEAQLPEGTRLPPEEELLSTMGCSRTGIRSALRLLESWGLITIQTGRNGGPVVRHPRVSDLKETMSILIYSEHATLADVLVARRAIDPIIAAEAANHATPSHIDQMDAVLKKMQEPTLTQRRLLLATAEFQGVLADASKLVILGLFLRILASFGEGSVMQQIPLDEQYTRHILASFGRIRDAIAERDTESARAEMVLHRKESERHWQLKGGALLYAPLGPFEFGP
jgi:GntR family transcriptional regulator, transcriptional repressor for pyruvate dehydrogenase complex